MYRYSIPLSIQNFVLGFPLIFLTPPPVDIYYVPITACISSASGAPGTLPTSKELPSRERDICAKEALPVEDVLVPTTRLIIVVD